MMKTKSPRIAAIAVLAAVLLQPLSFAQTPAQPMPGHAMTGSSTAPGGSMEMMAMMKDMNDKMMSMPMTGKTDIDFAKMMRVHHQGAIQTAEVELRDGKDADMKKMARKMIADQKKEIAEIDRFLAKQGQPVDKPKK